MSNSLLRSSTDESDDVEFEVVDETGTPMSLEQQLQHERQLVKDAQSTIRYFVKLETRSLIVKCNFFFFFFFV
jgi:hypothetical protein